MAADAEAAAGAGIMLRFVATVTRLRGLATPAQPTKPNIFVRAQNAPPLRRLNN
jgi:hypothetical protein